MPSASVLRRASRRVRGRDGGVSSYPWDGHVVALDASDDAYSARLQQGDPSEERVVRRALEGFEGKESRRFYRAGAATLGEPAKQMSCGRGTGHLGSGLYFFGLIEPARRSADRNDADVYRVVGGPRHPYVTGPAFDAAWKLHNFGKALLCIAGDLREYKALHHKRIALDEELKHAAGDEWDRIYDDLIDVKKDFRKEADEVARDIRHLEYSGPRLEDMSFARVYTDPDSVKLPPRIASAVERYLTERRYHPMTYYMRGLGYDGVVHLNPEQFRSGTIGNIWYPEV